MRFTCSTNTRYQTGVGDVQKPWIDYNLDYEKSIKRYFCKHLEVYDFDTCGEETVDFLFEDGKIFQLYHSWSRDDFGDYEEDETRFHFDYEVTEITESKISTWKDRDWIL